MKLYETKEKTGPRSALAAEEHSDHHPDMAGWWDVVGPVTIERGDAPYKGASPDEIIDAIDSQGVFIWVPTMPTGPKGQ
ncbi:hypothetical protein FJ872_19275 [Mesorhizobium sp. B2-5-9]|uniref:hypothetical protein n=1 Tax=Mesorhizobium sp. B2-5-9 TaxID=2589921 RepID=UPI00112997DE|nr:hypothetical protein [Mesorhizobium sp. B2-5-9]TPK15143.1 hypothetical protein FJ872_19275 [Mesorhizobium sp. B2-5-9]